MKITIQIRNTTDLEKLGDNTVNYFLKSSSEQLTNALKESTPVKEGNLRNAWKPKPIKNKQLVITNDTKYAIFVEKGTGLFGPKNHLIYPKNASVLKAKINNQTVFFKHSKGQKAQHMSEKGVKKFKPRIPSLLKNAIIKTRG